MWYESKTATAGPDRLVHLPSSPSSSIRARAAAGLLLGALLGGCATTPPPKADDSKPAQAEQAAEPMPPENVPVPAPVPASTPAPTPTPAPAQPPRKPYEGREHIIEVLDSGNEEATSSRTLVEAARAERERRAHAGPPIAVINDKNLKKQATGQLTYATPKKVEKGSEPAATVSDEPVRDEQYWRSRSLEIRLRWRHAADEVKELEKTASGWRRRFYAERDTYVRDGQIKPEWDRVLDRLEEARSEVVASTRELEELMEEGRKAGALPGWLREGVDQEPKEEPKPSNQHEVIEPPTAAGNGS